MALKEIKAEELTWNPFQQIGKEWFLVTAGTKGKCNGMTVSWGGLGVWWGKNAATVYIRKNRFTKTFIDAGERFTIRQCRSPAGRRLATWALIPDGTETSGRQQV